MPLVPPDLDSNTRAITITLPQDLAVRVRAYSEMAKASLDSCGREAFKFLLEHDKEEFEAFLREHPEALDGRKLRAPSADGKKPKKPASVSKLEPAAAKDRAAV